MDSPGPKEQGVALGRRVWPSQPRGTRGFTGSGRVGGGADDSGGRAGGCARAQLGEGRGRRAEKSVLGRLLARFTLECFASVIIRVSESPDGRPDPSGQRSIGGSRAWGSAGRRGGGAEDADHPGSAGPVAHGGTLPSKKVSGPGVCAGLSPRCCFRSPHPRVSRYQAIGPAVWAGHGPRLAWKRAGRRHYSICPWFPHLPRGQTHRSCCLGGVEPGRLGRQGVLVSLVFPFWVMAPPTTHMPKPERGLGVILTNTHQAH